MTPEKIVMATLLAMFIPAVFALVIVLDAPSAQAQTADGSAPIEDTTPTEGRAYDPGSHEGRQWNAVLSTLYTTGVGGILHATETVIAPTGTLGMTFDACKRIGEGHLGWTADRSMKGRARCINGATGDSAAIARP